MIANAAASPATKGLRPYVRLARFIGMRSPAHVAWCAEIRAMPFKKTAKTVIGYLEKAEMDALLAQPDRRTPLGDRDHALLLFLYNSGARADEAAKTDHRQPTAGRAIVSAATRQGKQVPDLPVVAGHRNVACPGLSLTGARATRSS